VQDADEAVAQGAQGLVVQVAGGAVVVVEVPGARTALQGAEGPMVKGVVEALVADVAGRYRAAARTPKPRSTDGLC
jgi:hypothetical protein